MNVTTQKISTISMIIFLMSSLSVIPLIFILTILNINLIIAIVTMGVIIIGSLISTTIFSMINFRKVDNTRKQELVIIKRNICLICGVKIGSQDDYCQNCGNKVN